MEKLNNLLLLPLWTFNKETLEPEQISLKVLFFPFFCLIFGLLIRFAPICYTETYSPADKKILKEKATVIEWLKYKAQQIKYDEIERNYRLDR